MAIKKITDDVIIDSYKKHQNVWKVGKEVGMCGQSVHERLTRLGVINKMNYWTEKENEILKEKYVKYRDGWMLDTLACEMGRTKHFICRQAKKLGLSCKNKGMPKAMKEKMSETRKEWMRNNEHPKGMLGKKHTESTKKIISENSKKTWGNPDHILNSEEYRQRKSDRMSRMQADGTLNKNYSRTKSGWVEIGGKRYFFRSSWESDIASYFEFLKCKMKIKDWLYEPTVFWFERIKRGVRSYKPDFLITRNDGTSYYVEVKGWMDNKSKTKLKRMRLYYPDVEIELIDQDRYKAIKKSSSIIPGWGALENQQTPRENKCKVADCGNINHSKGLCRKHYYQVYRK